MNLTMRVLPGRFAVCRRAPGAALPPWAMAGSFRSISWTAEETSIVCEESVVPTEVNAERGWRCLMIEGPLDFSLTGVLAGIAAPLASANISLFAISTFDTDYVLIKDVSFPEAKSALAASGHTIKE